MRNFDYYAIFGWMSNELGLYGVERDVYAVIYKSSQFEGQQYTGGLQYISELVGLSEEETEMILGILLRKKLIIRKEIDNGENKSVAYSVNHSFFK